MARKNNFIPVVSIFLILFFAVARVPAQDKIQAASSADCAASSGLSGMYQIDGEASDKLYSVIEGATSKIPYGEQREFFTDLALRLTPPDLLAIECRGNQIFLGSSRAPRIAFKADGVTRSVRAADGRAVESRIRFENNNLVFNSSGGGADKLSFTFQPIDAGTRLRVTRQIASEELIEPVIIKTVYNKIDRIARWNIYGEKPIAENSVKTTSRPAIPAYTESSQSRISASPGDDAAAIRQSLNQWLDATNRRDIAKQMSFYLPELKAFYLARNASRESVRAEKIRVFANARIIDIRAEQPEIIFQDNGQTAVMRFRKKYRVVNKSKTSLGEVVQELRWQLTKNGWKIFSERDIRVLS